MSLATSANSSDCIYEAALCFKINPLIIKSIIWQESKNRQEAINFNKNKTQDIGIMQINSIHLSSLSEIGISEKEIRENSCINLFSGSWILNKSIQRNGYSWEGIGKYHSKTPYYLEKYITKLITNILNENKKINRITVPYQSGIREKFSCK